MIYLCTMPPAHAKSRPHTTTAPLPLFFPSPIQLQSTPGAPFPLTFPIPPVRRWLVVHHPLISLHTTTHRSEQPPCDFEQPTPLPTSDPSTSIFSPFRQTRLRNQTRVARFWVLGSLGSAGRRIVQSVTAGAGGNTDGFGLEPTSIQPTHYAHNLAPAIQIPAVYPASRTYILISLPAPQAHLALPRPAKSIIGLFLHCRVDRTLPTFYFGPGIR